MPLTYYYSPSEKGFFLEEIHGSLMVTVVESAWRRPIIDVVLKPGETVQINDNETFTNTEDSDVSLDGIGDYSVSPPYIQIRNPDCKIPADSVPVTQEKHDELMQAQEKGLEIRYENGEFILTKPERISVVPDKITMRQARLMLHKEELLPSVQNIINALPEAQKAEAQIEWDYAQMVSRDNSIMQLIAQKIGLTDERLDEMFLEASTL